MRADGRRLPRVLFTIAGLERGGSEMQLVALVERLHGRRVEATVATLGPAADPSLRDRLTRAGVEILSLGGRGGPRPWRMSVAAARMGAELVRHHPDAVYAWLEEAALVTAAPARLTRTPFLIARRNILGPYAAWGRPVLRAIGFAERRAHVVTVNSRAVGDVTLARGVAPERIRLVPNGHVVEPELPQPPPGREIVIGYVARFRAEKGHRRLLDALSRIQTDVPWHVDLAGDGPLQADIAAEIARRGLDGRVRFTGAIADARAFWAERHVAALLSDHEGSPNALIEAAMAGRPIVATAVGGAPDVVGPEGGRLVRTDDPDEIAAALQALIEDGEARRRAAAAARRHAVAAFSMERSVEGHWAAIEQAISR
jgi:glycosyltransferase involved in cell wall biosynthesis